jgi:hypothetical protein
MTNHMNRPHAYKHLKDYQRAQWLKRYKLKMKAYRVNIH